MKWIPTFGAIALIASMINAVRAAPLDPSTVSAGAKWIVHIDFDALRESKVAEHVREEMMKHDLAATVMGMIKEATGIDPNKDLHGATAYGTGFKPHAGVLIVYAHADREKLVGLMKTRPDFKETKEGDLHLYSWRESQGDRHHDVVVAFPKPGTGVFADSVDQVKSAVAVLGGQGSLGSSSLLTGNSPKGTILTVSAIDINESDLPVKLDMLKKISSVSIVAGESDGTDFNHTRIATTDAETAKQLKSILDGVKATADLRLADQPEIRALVDATKVEANDKALAIEWSGSSDSVNKLVDHARDEFAKRASSRLRDARRAREQERAKQAEKKDDNK
jgi:hypothetical protein